MNITPIQITKYQTAGKICRLIYNELKVKIISGEHNIQNLIEYGNDRLSQELALIYKKETNKFIAYPVCISLNNCIGNKNENIIILEDDLIKIELGISISDCVNIIAETFRITKEELSINFLNEIEKDILDLIKVEEINDTIKIHIESKCTDNDFFPIENCISYQLNGNREDILEDSKTIILNYTKKFDLDDNLISEQNICYEFEEGDVFIINLSIIPSVEEIEKIYYKEIPSSFCHLNDFIYSLKLKHSRAFYNEIKTNYQFNTFDISKYTTPQNKIGITECIKSGLLEKLPLKHVYYNKNPLNVITKKFTILVGKNKSKIL